MKNNLKAFQGDFNEKLKHLSRLGKWLKSKQVHKSPAEIAEAIFNPIREFKASDCVIENYSDYQKKLGLPLWLGYLNRTIDHHNSKGFDFRNEGYEYTYYKEFLLACKEGVDYSKMLYPWQLFLLKEFIPGAHSKDNMLNNIIELHENAIVNPDIDVIAWQSAQNKLEKLINEIKEYKSVAYKLRRTAFLSVSEVIEIDDLWTSSAEAAADAKTQYILDTEPNADENIIRQKVWKEIMDHLLLMLQKWR